MGSEDNPDSVRGKALQTASDRLARMSLVLLAGGASRRMGKPKALLPVGGVTLVEWQVARLRGAFAETLVATGPNSPLPACLEPLRVVDGWPGAGPLAGIEAGLRAATREWVFTLGCDLPLATLDLARRLAAAAAGHEGAAPRVAGRAHPTCAVYARGIDRRLHRALGRGERRLAQVVGELDLVWVEDVEARLLTNLNTPADLEGLQGRLPSWERP